MNLRITLIPLVPAPAHREPTAMPEHSQPFRAARLEAVVGRDNTREHDKRWPGLMHPCRVTVNRIERTVRSAEHVQAVDRASAGVRAVIGQTPEFNQGGSRRGAAPQDTRRYRQCLRPWSPLSHGVSGGHLESITVAPRHGAERIALKSHSAGASHAPASSDGRASVASLAVAVPCVTEARPSDEQGSTL